jgi:geranylgeranyl transferase type-2 subunit beta
MSYLGALTLRLAGGAMQIPEETRRRHAAYLAAAQGPDGGFAGRDGPSDLYYTGFGLRALALVGELDEASAARAGSFLRENVLRPMPIVDFLSLVASAVLLEALFEIDVFSPAGLDRPTALAERLAPFRRDDGGYAKTPTTQSSTYLTFLAAATMQLAGTPLEDREATARLVAGRRREDGGFVELARLRDSATNPTAAAVGLLRLLDAVEEPVATGAVEFLATMQNVEGGLRANTKIPIADLLSTFTGLIALGDLRGLATIDAVAARRFVDARESPSGGFCAGLWDSQPDVEYTFYGLGALASLAAMEGT